MYTHMFKHLWHGRRKKVYTVPSGPQNPFAQYCADSGFWSEAKWKFCTVKKRSDQRVRFQTFWISKKTTTKIKPLSWYLRRKADVLTDKLGFPYCSRMPRFCHVLILPRTGSVYRIRITYVPTIQDCPCFSQINTWIWKKLLKTNLTLTIYSPYEKTMSGQDGSSINFLEVGPTFYFYSVF